MSHYLIVYDRAKGELRRCTEYTSERSGELALRDRFQIERQFPQFEVVVLGADSLTRSGGPMAATSAG